MAVPVAATIVPGDAQIRAGVRVIDDRLVFDSAFLGSLRDLEAFLARAKAKFDSRRSRNPADHTISLPTGIATRRALRLIALEVTSLASEGRGPGAKRLAELCALRAVVSRGAAELDRALAAAEVPAQSPAEITIAASLPFASGYLRARGVAVTATAAKTVIAVADRDKTVETLFKTLSTLRRRMEIIAANMANEQTTRDGQGKLKPYRRKILEIGEGGSLAVKEDPSKFRRVYKPAHADADDKGYILYPNVYMQVEKVDMADTAREYELIARAISVLRPDVIVPDALPADRTPGGGR